MCPECECEEPESEAGLIVCPRTEGCRVPSSTLRTYVHDLVLDEGPGFERALFGYTLFVLAARWVLWRFAPCRRRNVPRRKPRIFLPPGAEER